MVNQTPVQGANSLVNVTNPSGIDPNASLSALITAGEGRKNRAAQQQMQSQALEQGDQQFQQSHQLAQEGQQFAKQQHSDQLDLAQQQMEQQRQREAKDHEWKMLEEKNFSEETRLKTHLSDIASRRDQARLMGQHDEEAKYSREAQALESEIESLSERTKALMPLELLRDKTLALKKLPNGDSNVFGSVMGTFEQKIAADFNLQEQLADKIVRGLHHTITNRRLDKDGKTPGDIPQSEENDDIVQSVADSVMQFLDPKLGEGAVKSDLKYLFSKAAGLKDGHPYAQENRKAVQEVLGRLEEEGVSRNLLATAVAVISELSESGTSGVSNLFNQLRAQNAVEGGTPLDYKEFEEGLKGKLGHFAGFRGSLKSGGIDLDWEKPNTNAQELAFKAVAAAADGYLTPEEVQEIFVNLPPKWQQNLLTATEGVLANYRSEIVTALNKAGFDPSEDPFLKLAGLREEEKSKRNQKAELGVRKFENNRNIDDKAFTQGRQETNAAVDNFLKGRQASVDEFNAKFKPKPTPPRGDKKQDRRSR
jgi:hypothetical protein